MGHTSPRCVAVAVHASKNGFFWYTLRGVVPLKGGATCSTTHNLMRTDVLNTVVFSWRESILNSQSYGRSSDFLGSKIRKITRKVAIFLPWELSKNGFVCWKAPEWTQFMVIKVMGKSWKFIEKNQKIQNSRVFRMQKIVTKKTSIFWSQFFSWNQNW